MGPIRLVWDLATIRPWWGYWYFHVKKLNLKTGAKRVRRRGKLLVKMPYVEMDEDRNDQYRCKVVREQPFRSASSDVSQSCDRCNVDYQFLPCPPVLPEQASAGMGDATQLVHKVNEQPQDKSSDLLRSTWLYGCDL